ncbi:MAG: hypothetical protein R2874_15785 [Desulfobacterales bacterium]
MTDDSTDITERQRHVQRLEKLAAERRAILALDAKRALDAIIEHPRPVPWSTPLRKKIFIF